MDFHCSGWLSNCRETCAEIKGHACHFVTDCRVSIRGLSDTYRLLLWKIIMLQCQSPIQHTPLASMPAWFITTSTPWLWLWRGIISVWCPVMGQRLWLRIGRGGAEIHGCQCNTSAPSGKCQLALAATQSKSLNSQWSPLRRYNAPGITG